MPGTFNNVPWAATIWALCHRVILTLCDIHIKYQMRPKPSVSSQFHYIYNEAIKFYFVKLMQDTTYTHLVRKTIKY